MWGQDRKKLILMRVTLKGLMAKVTVEWHFKAQVDYQKDQMGEG